LTLTEMITQHYNHPSIIIWGMLNECVSETEEGRKQYQELLALMRSLDDSRPMVSASCKRGADWHIPGDMRPEAMGDLCHDLEDIVCHNIYPGWYTETSTNAMIDALWDAIQPRGGAGKPFIISEIGAGAIYGYHDPGHVKWSEERQSDILCEQLDALITNPHVAGFFLWQFCDCRITSEGNNFRDRPRTMNNKGAVYEYRRPKMAYYTIREKLRQENRVCLK
jgi:beta-glucuronidase